MHVTLMDRQKRRVPRQRLARVAKAVMVAEGCDPETEVTIVIGADTWIRRLNREFRKRDSPTDVLAFPQATRQRKRRPADPRDRRPPVLLGDVAISAETAERQARALGHSLAHELAVLVAHGVLHLTGWKDQTPRQRQRMARRVEEVLGLAGALRRR